MAKIIFVLGTKYVSHSKPSNFNIKPGMLNVKPVALSWLKREQVTADSQLSDGGASGHMQLLWSSHSVINKENVVVLKQSVAPLCRLHLPCQTKAHRALTGRLPGVCQVRYEARRQLEQISSVIIRICLCDREGLTSAKYGSRIHF